jgi:hypothetical protein
MLPGLFFWGADSWERGLFGSSGSLKAKRDSSAANGFDSK